MRPPPVEGACASPKVSRKTGDPTPAPRVRPIPQGQLADGEGRVLSRHFKPALLNTATGDVATTPGVSSPVGPQASATPSERAPSLIGVGDPAERAGPRGAGAHHVEMPTV